MRGRFEGRSSASSFATTEEDAVETEETGGSGSLKEGPAEENEGVGFLELEKTVRLKFAIISSREVRTGIGATEGRR